MLGESVHVASLFVASTQPVRAPPGVTNRDSHRIRRRPCQLVQLGRRVADHPVVIMTRGLKGVLFQIDSQRAHFAVKRRSCNSE